MSPSLENFNSRGITADSSSPREDTSNGSTNHCLWKNRLITTLHAIPLMTNILALVERLINLTSLLFCSPPATACDLMEPILEEERISVLKKSDLWGNPLMIPVCE